MTHEQAIEATINATPFHTSIGDLFATYSFIIEDLVVVAVYNRRTTATTYSVVCTTDSL
jgi:hypothetical protein